MKNLVLLIATFFSVVSLAQDTNGEKKPKLEIRSNNTDNEIHRKTNDHKSERIELRREERRERANKPLLERRQRPNFDGKRGEERRRESKTREINIEKRKEIRQELNQQRRERRENSK